MEGFVVIKVRPDGRVSLAINQVETEAVERASAALKAGAAQAAVLPGKLFGSFHFEPAPDGA